MKDDRFLIITGLSGSGKTVASRFLEDLGYYCIDNLPAKLIPSFVELWARREVEIEKVESQPSQEIKESVEIIEKEKKGFFSKVFAKKEDIKKTEEKTE